LEKVKERVIDMEEVSKEESEERTDQT